MPVRFLSDAELARLSSWPDEVADDDLVTYFTLTGDDLGWLASNVRVENRLGAAVQLCALPWLGWIPDELSACPAAAVRRLADQLRLADEDVQGPLADYGGWEGRTRRDHRALVLARLGWRVSSAGDRKQLDAFLLARALEHDAPGVLLQLACDWLRSERIVRPTVDTLSRRVAAARDGARAETYHRLASLLAPPRPAHLDRLLDVEDELGMTRLAWLRRGATAATPEVLKAELAKLEFLRAHGADRLDLSALPAGRRRMLAETGRRSTNQALQRADLDRRYPILLSTLAETYVEVLDELVQLLDQALAGADSRARYELSQRVVDRAKVELDRGRLLDEVLDILADAGVSDADAGRLVRARIGMARLQGARRPVAEREPRDHGHFDLLAARYKYLRTFTPAVIAHLPVTGNMANPHVAALLTAVEVLRELNAAGRTTVPDEAATEAATSFVPARWRGYLDQTRGQGRGAAYRHYWELSVLYGVQAKLRSGDVWVPGSRRYTDPTTLLIPVETWVAQRDDFCTVTGTDPDPARQLQRLETELNAAVADLERVLADPASEGLARVGEDGDLIVSPLPAEHVPAEAEALAETVAARLPQIHLPALLIEVDRATGFSEAFTHAGGAQPRNPDLVRNLYASVLAYACNLGYAGMADASGISEDTLAWTSQWYLRQDTLREANARLVNAHHRHPLAQLWGGGTLSSSDGQRFPQRGRSLTARALSRYFLDEGTTTYTHVSDQHSTYGTKVIPTTWREAVAVLDEIFGNPTDLAIAEHTTDTAGQTLATFAIFDLAGLQFSPRIRDIGRLQLYRLGAGSSWRSRYPHAGPLLTQPIQTQLIADHWNDLLRLVGSMKFGHTTASLLIAKLHASSRQNSLARALQEYGRLVRTIYLCRYVADEELRRRVRRQLNKGESLHALRRDLFFAHQGHVRRRHLDDQVDQALCLTLVTNAAVLWTTTYLGDALDALRADGYPVTDEAAAHLTPAQHDHINFYGTYSFDLETELRREGRRPLRSPAA
jgi:TnpA family transposase